MNERDEDRNAPLNEDFEPLTPREALSEIRRIVQVRDVPLQRWASTPLGEVNRLARDGLRRHGASAEIELTDELADRLAEAHKLLREIRQDGIGGENFGEIDAALALPPDLEQMLERRGVR